MSESRVRRIVEVVAVGALVALAAFLALAPVPDQAQWRAAAFFAAFGVLASSLAYRTSQTTLGSIGFLPSLSVALVAPNSAALFAVLVSTLAAEIIVRRQAIKAVFNAAQHVFSVAIAIFGYVLFGGDSLLHSSPRLLPFAVLVVVYFTLNKLAVSTIVTAAQGGSTRSHWLKSMRGSALYDALAFPLILFFAVAYVRLGAGWSAALAVPMLGIRQLYQAVFALQRINEELLQLMVASIEARDPYTSGHSQRVSRYARVISGAAGLSARVTERTVYAALLHDVGKIHEEFAVILRKPGRLTDDEFRVMKTHPTKSAELVGKVSQFADLIPAVRSHHEAWDGSGYPQALRGNLIPLGARVIALADTIDAMTTSRPYRSGMDLEQVRVELESESGRQFDPEICARLLTSANWTLLMQELDAAQLAHPVVANWSAEAVQGRTGEYQIAASTAV